jgi:multimeric flavodoxin WrbA
MPNSLRAIFINCTLKYSPEISNTDALVDIVAAAMKVAEPNIEIDRVRMTDYNVRFGAMNDMGEGDEWPQILERIVAADIIVIATPIWMGVRSSLAQLVIERLDGTTKVVPEGDFGQFPLYNKVAGVVVTGNEDGAHDCAATTLFNLAHFGCTVPPNTDCYWVGDAGPGPSFIEARGDKHPYTLRNAKLTAQNLVYAARLIKANPYPTNVKAVSMEMMARNMEIWPAQAKLREQMYGGDEK